MDEIADRKFKHHLTLTNDFFDLKLWEFLPILKFVHVVVLVSDYVCHNLLFTLQLLSLIFLLADISQITFQLGLERVRHKFVLIPFNVSFFYNTIRVIFVIQIILQVQSLSFVAV